MFWLKWLSGNISCGRIIVCCINACIINQFNIGPSFTTCRLCARL